MRTLLLTMLEALALVEAEFSLKAVTVEPEAEAGTADPVTFLMVQEMTTVEAVVVLDLYGLLLLLEAFHQVTLFLQQNI